LGQGGFGTRYVYPHDGALPGDDAVARTLPVDLAANAASLGARVIQCRTYAEFAEALHTARGIDCTTVIYVKNDRLDGVPGYDSWWDVPVAEVSESPTVKDARREWEANRVRERYFF
jgi:3D-(3,5/4)-trihydroxycyclohexane-1,2-dione acylhydrolase (decyclizing)